MPLTRRTFLLASAVTGGSALLAGAAAATIDDLMSRASTDPLVAGEGILVLVTLYGGNDGINTVVPYADSAYHDLRKDLAYAEDEVLHLDDTHGLNPALPGLKKTWDGGKLAVVQGVGYPKPDRSHFRSMDIWQTASPDAPVGTGWVGRWLDATGDDPLRAVNIGPVLPPLAVGAKATAAALDVGRRRPLNPQIASAATGLGDPDASDTPTEALVSRSCSAQLTVAATFDDVLDPDAGDPDDDPQSDAGSAGGQGELAAQLDVVARCIKAGVPTKVYCVSLGGFDTHADERGTQEALLASFDEAVSGFLDTLADDPRGAGAIVVAYSEFGRRVAANASDGTDHGTAGPLLVAGPSVTGGWYGEAPSLTDLDNGDLRASTDFRAVYAELLSGALAADPAQVLGKAWDPIGFLS